MLSDAREIDPRQSAPGRAGRQLHRNGYPDLLQAPLRPRLEIAGTLRRIGNLDRTGRFFSRRREIRCKRNWASILSSLRYRESIETNWAAHVGDGILMLAAFGSLRATLSLNTSIGFRMIDLAYFPGSRTLALEMNRGSDPR
jgi:hypothetical protein